MEWILSMAGLCTAGAVFPQHENKVVLAGLVLLIGLLWLKLGTVGA